MKVVPRSEMMLVVYGDSSFGNAPNGKCQGGLVVEASKQALDSLPHFWSGETIVTNVSFGARWRQKQPHWTVLRTMAIFCRCTTTIRRLCELR